ncbi:hypothetical protein CAL12_23475 [Bordetella genomosp. 8]|uniref:ABC transmembrane type-1 domain-containing protein n=1 Tax=Bordetella genomosp. 8 TaxID=1416806 RepID=A0A1W6YR59_9BORD|nr:ABC transporter permease [Bordetella genomosp. 8]ARP83488.1 hypothetical protein CAL12_23475 [Bordetella genomosp. 8]
MLRYIALRLAFALPVIAAVLTLVFFLTRVVPGDPLTALVGDFPAPPEYVAQVRQSMGLDQPLPRQFFLYVRSLARGDIGYSLANQQPVLTLVLDRAGNTLLLMIPALLLASLVGVLLGLWSAAARRRGVDTLITSVGLLGYSVPAFWLGQILILVFAVDLKWLPAQGMHSVRTTLTGASLVLDVMRHWVLPGVAVTLFYCAVVARVGRASVLEAIHQDFVTTAKAKGASDRRVLWRHVLPNALMPIISVIGYNFGNAITGTILVEAVFAWPGLGGLFVTAIAQRDYPVLQGVFLAAAVTVIVANLITDLLYAYVDPRVRHEHYGR